MAPLHGFADNPLRTRADFQIAVNALIAPIEHHRSSLGARVKIHPASCAGFDDVAAQVEGFCRPLLGISAILDDSEKLDRWCQGLEAGVDVDGEEYWGDMEDFDQRMVETESICIALLTAPDALLSRISERGKNDLVRWMRQINQRTMPPNNWRWFRLFVNLTLTKIFRVPKSEVESVMDLDFALLDSFDMGDGWSSDGPWTDDRKQADYYSGSFAIQFAQLLYVRFAEGDEERVEKYKKQAREFASNYWRYFDVDGAAIPFGRSMTYRFAFAAFWGAVAVAGVHLPPPLDNLGTVKGLLLRHLRWWTRQEDIFNADGIMNIGFAYPNMYLAEDYNSPQSVYWCLKSFVALVLPEDHRFWQCEELPHPLDQDHSQELCKTIWPPRQILNNTPEHHYMLSLGQMTTKPHKGKDAKYSKFAYSSAFAFSVPSGTTLGQLAPDSTLSLTIDDGQTWQVHGGNLCDTRLETVALGNHENVQGLVGTWKPWKRLDLEVETTLVPLAHHYPGWHVRIHRIQWTQSAEAAVLADAIRIVDAGFAIPCLTTEGTHLPHLLPVSLAEQSEGQYEDASTALVRSQAGAGGIIDLTSGLEKPARARTEASVLRADPNTNLISPRTSVACMNHHLVPGKADDSSPREVWLASGVYAASGSRLTLSEASQMWQNRPFVSRVKAEGNTKVRFRIG